MVTKKATPGVAPKTAARKQATPARPRRAPTAATTAAPAKPAPVPVSRVPAPPASKPGAAPTAKPALRPAKPEKLRVKLVRDSFTMPADEFAAIDTLKARALEARRPAKKSELLRVGLQLILQLDAAALIARLEALPALKAGRPKKNR